MKKITLILIVGIYLMSMIILASALTITSVSTGPEIITPGESSIIKLTLENKGSEDIEDVSISLDFKDVPFAPSGSSSEVSFDEIREGRDKSAEFRIIALSDAASGIYKIPLEINYRITGETQINTKKSLIGIRVNSKPIISANIEDGLILKSQESILSIKVTNRGLSDVKFLEVELQPGTYYTLLGQKNVYIGDISSDDFDTAEIKVYFKESAPSNINLPVIVRYKDNLNNEYEENLNLQTKIYTTKQATNLGLIKKSNLTTYIILIIAVIIVYFIYRNIRKRKKIKKAEESY